MKRSNGGLMAAMGLSLALAVSGLACGGDDGGEGSLPTGGTGSGSSPSAAGTCDGQPAGSYKCSGSYTIMQCRNGAWAVARSCGCSVSVGDPRKPPYSATCKITIGSSGSVQCDYAGTRCLSCPKGGACTCVGSSCGTTGSGGATGTGGSTGSSGACSRCLSSCRGLSSCCCGTGCICASSCTPACGDR